MLNMDPAFLNRSVNEGFSGGEKKRNEILQLACLEADCAILDEIDSGLDIDALRDVANAVNALKKERPDSAIIMVTHYKVERGAGWLGYGECPISIVSGGFRCHGVLKLGWRDPRCMIARFLSFADPLFLFITCPIAAAAGLHSARPRAHHAKRADREDRGHGSCGPARRRRVQAPEQDALRCTACRLDCCYVSSGPV